MATKASAYLSMLERAQDAALARAGLAPRRFGSPRSARSGAPGFPTTRDEEWRFTNVAPIADTPFVPAPAGRGLGRGRRARSSCPASPGPVLVFVNGRFTPRAVDARRAVRRRGGRSSLADALAETRPRSSRTSAATRTSTAGRSRRSTPRSFEDGALSSPSPTTRSSSRPSRWCSCPRSRRAPAVSHPRVLAVLGRNSQARVVETFAGLGAGARLHQRGHRDRRRRRRGASTTTGCSASRETAFHVGHTQFQLGRSSRVVVARDRLRRPDRAARRRRGARRRRAPTAR